MKDLPFTVYDFFAYLASGFWLLLIIGIGIHQPWYTVTDISSLTLLAWIVIAYITGHVIAHLSGTLLETMLVHGHLQRDMAILFEQPKDWRPKIFPGFFKPLPATTQQRVLDRAVKAKITTPDEALFLHALAIVKNDTVAFGRMNTFLALYGFARNISMASLLGMITLVITSFPGGITSTPDWYRVAQITLLLLIAIIMFYRYLKFYRLYTVEIYTTYAEGA